MNHEILDNLALFYDAIEKSNIDKQNNFFQMDIDIICINIHNNNNNTIH